MKLVVFEAESREKDYLSNQLDDFDVVFIDEPLKEATAHQAADAEVISVFIHSTVDKEVLGQLESAKLITTRSTGFDHIDLATCKERGIAVTNVPTYGENTVAEHTIALILGLTRKIHQAWHRTQRGDFSLDGLQGFDLKGKTLGVVGAGNIGKHVIRIARGFGMEVLAYDVDTDHILAEVLGFDYVSLDDLLRSADIISLHVPAIPATHHMINREAFKKMKRCALLINTARGSVVDTDALTWALDEGILDGAGLDVLEGEELIKEERELLRMPQNEQKLRLALQQHVLQERENVIITPHMAFYSREAIRRIMDQTIANIRSFMADSPENLVTSGSENEPAAAPGR